MCMSLPLGQLDEMQNNFLEDGVMSSSKAFPDGGIYVLRSSRMYLLAVCHQIGVNGHGPHKHNDWLSFELCQDSRPVVIDPGTYCYTGDVETRRMFRSTAYHNTVVVDRQDQIQADNAVFGLSNAAGEVQVAEWLSDGDVDILEAEHTGYFRLSSPLIHRRKFHLDKRGDTVEIADRFVGHGEHLLEWYFHLNSELTCSRKDNSLHVLNNGKPLLKIEPPPLCTQTQIQKGWISEEYNVRREAEIIKLRFEGELQPDLVFAFNFCPL